MNKLRMQKISWFLFPEMLCVLLITFFTMIGQDTIVSIMVSISFLLIIIACGQMIATGRINIYLSALVILSLCSVMINLLANGRLFVGLDYYKKLIMFLLSVLFYYYASKIEITKKTLNNIRSVC